MKFSSLNKTISKFILYCNILILFFPYQNSFYLKYLIIFLGLIIFAFGFYNKKNLIIFNSFYYFGLYIIITSFFHINSIVPLINGILYISIYFIFQYYLILNKGEIKMFFKNFINASFIISLIFLINTLIFKKIDRTDSGASFYWIYYGHSYISSLIIFPLLYSFIYKKHFFYKFIFFSVFILSLSKGVFFSFTFSLFLFLRDFFPLKKILLAILFLIISFSFILINSKFIVGTNKNWKISRARVVYLQSGFDAFIKNPYIGYGFGNFNLVNNKKNIFSTEYLHNYYFQIIMETGIFGSIIFLPIVKKIYFFLRKKVKNLFYIIIKIVLMVGIFNNLVNIDWNLTILYLYFWIFLSLFINKNTNNLYKL